MALDMHGALPLLVLCLVKITKGEKSFADRVTKIIYCTDAVPWQEHVRV